MMFPHYIPAVPVCYLGLGSVEQVFGVALEERGVMVVVEQVVEVKELEESCTGASTPDEVHSTEVMAEHKSETNE